MTEILQDLGLPAAVLGPAAAGGAWLALARWAGLRWVAGGGLWLASQAGLWWVFWETYRGGSPSWAGLEPDLLGATLAALTGVAVTLLLPAADRLPWRTGAPAVAGLAAATASIVGAAYTQSLVPLAILVPVPTVAAALGSLGGEGRRNAPGVLGLALADGAILLGIAILLDRGGTTVIGPVAGLDLGAALVLSGAAVKAGVVPWVGTSRLAARGGAGAPLAVPLRAQGAVLALVVAIRVAEAPPSLPLASAAGVAALLCGAAALLSRDVSDVRALTAGAAAAAFFLPLGLGGSVGIRAALFLFPVVLIAPAVVEAGGGPIPAFRAEGKEWPRHPAWRWVGGTAVLLGVVSLAGVPPGGGFPGTWVSLMLATARAGTDLSFLPAAGGVAVGLGLALFAAAPAIRVAEPRPVAASLGLAGGVTLLYLGLQPVRLGLGWSVRAEAQLGLPVVLPSSGAPSLPPVAGWDLLWALLPAVAAVLGLAVLARGVGERTRAFEPLVRLDRPGWLRLPSALRPAARPVGAVVAGAREMGMGYAVALVVEGAAVALAAWVVVAGLRLGFL